MVMMIASNVQLDLTRLVGRTIQQLLSVISIAQELLGKTLEPTHVMTAQQVVKIVMMAPAVTTALRIGT